MAHPGCVALAASASRESSLLAAAASYALSDPGGRVAPEVDAALITVVPLADEPLLPPDPPQATRRQATLVAAIRHKVLRPLKIPGITSVTTGVAEDVMIDLHSSKLLKLAPLQSTRTVAAKRHCRRCRPFTTVCLWNLQPTRKRASPVPPPDWVAGGRNPPPCAHCDTWWRTRLRASRTSCRPLRAPRFRGQGSRTCSLAR